MIGRLIMFFFLIAIGAGLLGFLLYWLLKPIFFKKQAQAEAAKVEAELRNIGKPRKKKVTKKRRRG